MAIFPTVQWSRRNNPRREVGDRVLLKGHNCLFDVTQHGKTASSRFKSHDFISKFGCRLRRKPLPEACIGDILSTTEYKGIYNNMEPFDSLIERLELPLCMVQPVECHQRAQETGDQKTPPLLLVDVSLSFLPKPRVGS